MSRIERDGRRIRSRARPLGPHFGPPLWWLGTVLEPDSEALARTSWATGAGLLWLAPASLEIEERTGRGPAG